MGMADLGRRSDPRNLPGIGSAELEMPQATWLSTLASAPQRHSCACGGGSGPGSVGDVPTARRGRWISPHRIGSRACAGSANSRRRPSRGHTSACRVRSLAPACRGCFCVPGIRCGTTKISQNPPLAREQPPETAPNNPNRPMFVQKRVRTHHAVRHTPCQAPRPKHAEDPSHLLAAN